MSRRNKKRRRRQLAFDPSDVYFTLPTLRMIKNSLTFMEQSVPLTTKSLPNLDFAVETLEVLKMKLEDMLQREEWNKKTPLDYNEIQIINASVHMYLVKLTFHKNHVLMNQCLTLCNQFTRLVEYSKKK